jgi:hypothetical protein
MSVTIKPLSPYVLPLFSKLNGKLIQILHENNALGTIPTYNVKNDEMIKANVAAFKKNTDNTFSENLINFYRPQNEQLVGLDNNIIRFICEGGTVTSFQQGDLYILRKVGVASYILNALHHDTVEYNIMGGVPPSIALYAAVIKQINYDQNSNREASFVGSSSATSSSEDGERHCHRRPRRRRKKHQGELKLI